MINYHILFLDCIYAPSEMPKTIPNHEQAIETAFEHDQKRGLIGPKKTANILSDLLDVLRFLMYFEWFWGDFNYSKMAN